MRLLRSDCLRKDWFWRDCLRKDWFWRDCLRRRWLRSCYWSECLWRVCLCEETVFEDEGLLVGPFGDLAWCGDECWTQEASMMLPWRFSMLYKFQFHWQHSQSMSTFKGKECEWCDYNFTSKCIVNIHLSRRIGKRAPSIHSAETQNPKFKCENCSESFPLKSNFARHLKETHCDMNIDLDYVEGIGSLANLCHIVIYIQETL